MADVVIRNLPREVHEEFVRRARAAGVSLERLLIEQLSQTVNADGAEEMFDRIELRDLGEFPAADALSAIRDLRACR